MISDSAAVDLQLSHTVEFGTSRIYTGRVLEMQWLGYFGSGIGRAPRAKYVPEPEGELVVFEAFFATGLRLPAHRFVVEVLRRFEVQIHQLTPRREAKLAQASMKAAAPAAAMPPPMAPAAAARLPSPPHATKTAVSGTSGDA
jgi:hypothetical protein